MTTTIIKSSIPSHGLSASNNQFHNLIDSSQGIDFVESMPGVLKKFENSASGGPTGGILPSDCRDAELTPPIHVGFGISRISTLNPR
jgi:hypothetical protein